MATRDIPTHFATTIATTTARIMDYRERRLRLTESYTIRVLVLPVLQALGWRRIAIRRYESARSLICSSQYRLRV